MSLYPKGIMLLMVYKGIQMCKSHEHLVQIWWAGRAFAELAARILDALDTAGG